MRVSDEDHYTMNRVVGSDAARRDSPVYTVNNGCCCATLMTHDPLTLDL